MRMQILEEAEEYKRAFFEKRKLNIETNKTTNREKEKVFFLPPPPPFVSGSWLCSLCFLLVSGVLCRCVWLIK